MVHRFTDGDDLDWPGESFGRCKNFRRCRNENVWLANRVCVDCWDRGIGHPFKDVLKGKKRVHRRSRKTDE